MNKHTIAIVAVFSFILLAHGAVGIKTSVINYDPLPAKAGQFVDVFISIENNSKGDTGQVTIELVPKDSIRLPFNEPAVKNIGIISGNSATVVKYRLEITQDAVDGTNTLALKVREADLPLQEFDLEIEVDNDLPNIEIGKVVSEPKKIIPDSEDVKLTVTILNTGNKTAENLRATLVLPEELEASESFSDLALLGNIANDSSQDTVFFIDVPRGTRGGKYTASIETEYTTEGAQRNAFITKEISFEIPVKPAPNLEIVSAKTSTQTLAAGQRDVQLLITVQNNGDAQAESVRIKVFQKSEQPFTFDKEFDFLAPTLDPGQSAQATLEFGIDEDAAVQDYLLDIELKSVLEDDVIINKDVAKITVSKGKEQGPDFLIAGIAALVIVGLVATYYYRRFLTISKGKEKGLKQ